MKCRCEDENGEWYLCRFCQLEHKLGIIEGKIDTIAEMVKSVGGSK